MKPTDPSSTPPTEPLSTELDVAKPGGTETLPARPSLKPADDPTTLVGYQLGELLGRGGMGEVMLAEDLEIGRKVAIKRMRNEAPSANQVDRFLREAKIQARLDHPAIVPVHVMGRDRAGRPYFTMKRLTGTTLSELIKAGVTSQQRLLRAFADVCLAIEFAHTRGFIHRDLKPSNVMLGDFGEVYVIDWGLARAIDETDPDSLRPGEVLGGETETGAVLGTPGYMSPEQIRGELVGTATDVYALGAILFEILTGAHLHPRGHAALVATLTGGATSPAERTPERGIAPELDALCVEALHDQPERRPSARTLADRVQRYLDGDRDLERRRTLAEELLRTARGELASGDPGRRGNAMNCAGRALALDPSSAEATAIVGKLMLEPPPVMPPALGARLAAADREHVRIQSKVAVLSLAAYFLFIPLNLWMGIRDWTAWVVVYGLVVVAIACARAMTRPELALVANALLLMALTRFTSPFLVVPTLAAMTAMTFMIAPQLQHRPATVIGTYVAAIVIPIVLESVGVLSSTWDISDGRFIATPTAVTYDGLPAEVYLVAVSIVIAIVLPLFVRKVSLEQRTGRQQLETQAWHLAHLVPEAARPER